MCGAASSVKAQTMDYQEQSLKRISNFKRNFINIE